MRRKDRLVIVIDRRAAALGAGVLAALALTALVRSENMTLTMTYPVPAGIYNQIITTGNSGAVAADTTLARNAGNVVLSPGTNVNGAVGIGTSAPPASKLEVDGNVIVKSNAADKGDLTVTGQASASAFLITGSASSGAKCSANGLVSTDGKALLLCVKGTWKGSAQITQLYDCPCNGGVVSTSSTCDVGNGPQACAPF